MGLNYAYIIPGVGKIIKGIRGREIAAGDRYEGEFVNGLKAGSGKMVFANKDSYEGAWVADKMHGAGVLDRGGDVYTGLLFEGLRHGHGVQEHTVSGAQKTSGAQVGMGFGSFMMGGGGAAISNAKPKPMNAMARMRVKAQGLLPLRSVFNGRILISY